MEDAARKRPKPLISAALVEFLAGGVAVVAATRDEQLRPEIVRAWGPSVEADRASMTICLPAEAGSRTRANLSANGAIAATFSLPTTYKGVQLKGRVLQVREPSEEELERVDAHLAAFAAEADGVGIPASLVPRMLDPALTTVSFTVEELFDQTPGSRAGSAL